MMSSKPIFYRDETDLLFLELDRLNNSLREGLQVESLADRFAAHECKDLSDAANRILEFSTMQLHDKVCSGSLGFGLEANSSAEANILKDIITSVIKGLGMIVKRIFTTTYEYFRALYGKAGRLLSKANALKTSLINSDKKVPDSSSIHLPGWAEKYLTIDGVFSKDITSDFHNLNRIVGRCKDYNRVLRHSDSMVSALLSLSKSNADTAFDSLELVNHSFINIVNGIAEEFSADKKITDIHKRKLTGTQELFVELMGTEQYLGSVRLLTHVISGRHSFVSRDGVDGFEEFSSIVSSPELIVGKLTPIPVKNKKSKEMAPGQSKDDVLLLTNHIIDLLSSIQQIQTSMGTIKRFEKEMQSTMSSVIDNLKESSPTKSVALSNRLALRTVRKSLLAVLNPVTSITHHALKACEAGMFYIDQHGWS